MSKALPLVRSSLEAPRKPVCTRFILEAAVNSIATTGYCQGYHDGSSVDSARIGTVPVTFLILLLIHMSIFPTLIV